MSHVCHHRLNKIRVNAFSFKVADEEYKSAFYSELEAFKERIRKRAAEKIAEAMEEERQANMGPGGLDPADVFESLPRFSDVYIQS